MYIYVLHFCSNIYEYSVRWHDKMKSSSYASLGKYRRNRLWVSCKGTFLRVIDIDFSSSIPLSTSCQGGVLACLIYLYFNLVFWINCLKFFEYYSWLFFLIQVLSKKIRPHSCKKRKIGTLTGIEAIQQLHGRFRCPTVNQPSQYCTIS